MVIVELRGVTLGVLTNGSLRVTDLTPHDRYAPTVTGRKLTQQRINARTVVFRGQGLRFKMIGGSYRFVARGNGIAPSGVGWGSVTLTASRSSSATTSASTPSTGSTAATSRSRVRRSPKRL